LVVVLIPVPAALLGNEVKFAFAGVPTELNAAKWVFGTVVDGLPMKTPVPVELIDVGKLYC